MKINMVRVEVVGDVGRLAGPGLRCFFCVCLVSVSLSTPSAWRFSLCVSPRPRPLFAPSTRPPQTDAVSYFKRLELVLRLAHVGLEEGERAELLDPVARVPIYRIVPFMDLDAA